MEWKRFAEVNKMCQTEGRLWLPAEKSRRLRWHSYNEANFFWMFHDQSKSLDPDDLLIERKPKAAEHSSDVIFEFCGICFLVPQMLKHAILTAGVFFNLSVSDFSFGRKEIINEQAFKLNTSWVRKFGMKITFAHSKTFPHESQIKSHKNLLPA